MRLVAALHERRCQAIVSAALLAGWVASLPLLVAVVDHRDRIDEYQGWMILLLGILGTLIAQMGWWGNPILLGACIYLVFSRVPPRKGILLALAVMLLVCLVSSLFWRSVMDDSGIYPIIRYGPGYFLWLATITLCAAWLTLLAITGKAPQST
jgi:H+/Cl- antiporter ClcA